LSLAVCLEPWFQSWKGSRTTSDSLLQTALGDGRKLFASHFYAKADAYFHNGYYPTVFDNRDGYAKAHIAADMHKVGEEDEATENYLGKARDWIDAFGRHFYPARHTHLGDSGCGHSCCQRAKAGQGHDDDCEHKDHGDGHHEAKRSDEREILPWLRFSAELDPERVETYVVCAYWLRSALKKVDEAEQFLRTGLRANPGEPELLFELGRIFDEERQDPSRARNVWELGLKNWHRRESGKVEPNLFLRAQLLGYLATLEEKQGRYARAIEHLTVLKSISPNKDSIQRWIDEIRYEHAP
jgi:tetratricopeptide (TPR) repeat protein